jgi:hypothetical protein
MASQELQQAYLLWVHTRGGGRESDEQLLGASSTEYEADTIC